MTQALDVSSAQLYDHSSAHFVDFSCHICSYQPTSVINTFSELTLVFSYFVYTLIDSYSQTDYFGFKKVHLYVILVFCIEMICRILPKSIS